MKKDIHPNFREVAFKDSATGTLFITRSTVETKETVTHEGTEYPMSLLDISSASHPFYTGKQQLVDTAGRVERFNRKYNIKPKG
ncbi:type B 50S ribosomal protein L31 [Spirochaeta africana]|uniref:50S ribosomal protein L31 n=1 Tax=Spirochaeta africana (strain ATCC 700263 / DSM 8902 / Z-7692) TaxID=889378 RepID=H9UKE4_SPIAZ|nr:type B 50S ribosomal protein L31 [Spirochaeta africana]AFG37987.1 ribosomal protein L31 [Spirochaeta africana DSM 8902]